MAEAKSKSIYDHPRASRCRAFAQRERFHVEIALCSRTAQPKHDTGRHLAPMPNPRSHVSFVVRAFFLAVDIRLFVSLGGTL